MNMKYLKLFEKYISGIETGIETEIKSNSDESNYIYDENIKFSNGAWTILDWKNY